MEQAETLHQLEGQYFKNRRPATPRQVVDAGEGYEDEFEMLEPLYQPTKKDLRVKGEIQPKIIFID